VSQCGTRLPACVELGELKSNRNRLLLFAAAFLFSTGGAAIKACSLTSWQVAGFRCGIAAVVLLILLPEARRGWTWRTGLVGIAYAATMILFVLATKLTTSANAIFLQSTAPLYLLILGPLVLNERIRRLDLLVIAAVAGGAVLLLLGSEHAGATAPDPARGNVLAALTGLVWAVTLAGLRWLGRKPSATDPAAATVIIGNLIAFAVSLPFALPVVRIAPVDVAVLLYLGIFQIGLAYVALTRSIRHIPALEASTLLMVEPVFNPIWTWLIHGERPSSFALAGGSLIVFATSAATWVRGRSSDKTARQRLGQVSS
jgi:drug/metabolite transporter, DME family